MIKKYLTLWLFHSLLLYSSPTYKMAFVKQVVYSDLYCAPTQATAAEIILSSLKRSGPVALFTKLNTDFYIVNVEPDPECTIWKEKVTHCKHSSIQYYQSLAFTPGRWHTIPQGHYAVNCDEINWGQYDIVISVDIAIPARITKQYPQTLWTYYISEGCMPAHRQSYKSLVNGYDCYLTQDFHQNRKLASHAIDFPYHLQYYGCFHELFNESVEPEIRRGITLETHTAISLSGAQKNQLKKYGPVSSVSKGPIDKVIKWLMQTKYYIFCIEPKPGVRQGVRGNAITEAVATGNLVIAKQRGLNNKGLLTRLTSVNSFRDVVNRIQYFEKHPEAYKQELIEQRKKLNWLCFERPTKQLFEKYEAKRKGLASKRVSSSSLQTIKIHPYLTHLFKKDPIVTEYKAYQSLQKNPLKQSINYLAMPWAVLINTKRLNTVPSIKLDGGFTICQHIHYEKIIPILKRIGIDVLFTPHVPHHKKYKGITVLPFPHYPVHGVEPATHKNILYSFVGCNTHPVRKALANIANPDNAVVISRTKWHFYNNIQTRLKEKKEYQDILSRSRFSLCPRGTGASTPRFWESLQAGAIPVLISDDMGLPDGFDWDSCIIRVPENTIEKIPLILKNISPEEETRMRKLCLQAHKLFSDNNFVRSIHCFYTNK